MFTSERPGGVGGGKQGVPEEGGLRVGGDGRDGCRRRRSMRLSMPREVAAVHPATRPCHHAAHKVLMTL